MIEHLDLERLRSIGLAPALLQNLLHWHDLNPGPEDDTGNPPALLRVTEVQRESLLLHDGAQERAAQQLPALRSALADAGDALAVGDWVLARCNAFGQWWAHARVPPVNQLARRLHDGRDKVTRAVIVSNVDTALLVMGLDKDFNLSRLERYVALVRMAGVTPLVVLSKSDLCDDPAQRQRQAQALLPADACAVTLNSLSDEPPRVLAPWLGQGQTLVLLGSSGAGKSTLTNALIGEAAQLIGPNRSSDGRGRHTTTARSLHVMPGGACIIDTPGLRTLRLDGDASELGALYDDIAQLALQCRFRDCHHEAEPGCAVRDGVAPERLRSFQKLQREARRDTQSALERKAQVSQWKARGRLAKARIAGKRHDPGRG